MEPTKDDKASGTSNSKKTFPPPELRRKRRTPSERRSWEDRAVGQELGSQRRQWQWWQWGDKGGKGRHKIFQPLSLPASCLLLPLAKPNQWSWQAREPIHGSANWGTETGRGVDSREGWLQWANGKQLALGEEWPGLKFAQGQSDLVHETWRGDRWFNYCEEAPWSSEWSGLAKTSERRPC